MGAVGPNGAPSCDEASHDSEPGRPSRSWSQYNSYRECGKAYQLQRILQVPQRGAVWFASGRAVHSCIERYLHEPDGFDVALTWQLEFAKAVSEETERSGFPVDEWFLTGRTKPAKAIEEWFSKGIQHVQNFIDWYESSDYEVWTTPDGIPAIELELRPMFGDIEVRMFIDLVLVGPHGLVVVDTKSGSTKPYSLQQQGMYACGIELTYGIRPLFGAFFLTRGTGPRGAEGPDRTYFQPPQPLSDYRYSVDFYTAELQAMERGIESKVFLANVSDSCDRCTVAQSCLAVGGWEARKYDPAHPDYTPSMQG